MASSPAGSVASFEIKVAGTSIADTLAVLRVTIEQAINRIANATIVILDGDPSVESFAVSSSATFVPGNTVSIACGYDGTNSVVFEGIIVKQNLRVGNSVGPMLEVVCQDKSIKMTVGRKSAGYANKKDSDVISQLIADAGLSANVAATDTTLPELVQYYSTDWDFMLARAEVNSMVVAALNGKVRVFNPTADTSSVATFTYGGEDFYAFNADLNSITQYNQVKATAWDFQNQQLVSAQAANNLAGPGNLSSKTLAGVVGLSDFQLQSGAAPSSAELTCWAKAQMLKSELAKIMGDLRVQGTAAVLPGNYITLAGLGTRFDGDHFVSCVRHELNDGNWIVECDIGLNPVWFVQQHQVEAPSAAGLVPGMQGLMTGVVKQIDSDPDNEYRVLVEVALFNDQGAGVWARIANFYSTSGKGAFFLPEVGDEVVLGFLNQDPRYPIVVGSLYSQKNKPFSLFAPNAQNSMKGIVTKGELQILFDDQNKVMKLITPNKNTLVLDDQNQQIELKDQNDNSILMSSSGITIKSASAITLQAPQTVTIQGDSGVKIQASTGDCSISALNASIQAEQQFSAKGSLQASVQGGTALELKALMVNIN